MSVVVFHILVYIPAYNKYPLNKVQKKDPVEVKEQLNNVTSGRRKAARTYEDYIENIAKPQLEAFIKSLNPEFVSRAGLTAEQLIKKMQEKLFSKEAYENYIKGISDEDITRIIEELPKKSADYARKKTFGGWRLEGPLPSPNPSPSREGKGEGVSAMKIILGWLAPTPKDLVWGLDGNLKIVSALRPQDELKQGNPIQVIPPERSGEFKRKLPTLLKQMLDIIQCAHYAPSVVAKQNDRLKQFVDSYVNSEFVVSIKWVVIPESVIPADSTEVKEIEYKIYEHFLGEEKAKHIRAQCIETAYRYPLNPADYLGNPNQKAYFDMFLDIQISKR
ncbi:MAG: hypothetical protein V1709_00440 [Planctomycetota bacterium]